MSHVVALLGPRAAGKSSVGRLLARGLGWGQHSADEHCFAHYRELPEVRAAESQMPRAPDEKLASSGRRYLEALQAIVEREQGAARWWQLFERMRLHAALRSLAQAGPVIIDLGAGHARFSDPAHRAALDEALARCHLAIWLQPFADPQRAAACLALRLSVNAAALDLSALLRACAPDERPRLVETMFTEERPSEAVAAELLARLQRPV